MATFPGLGLRPCAAHLQNKAAVVAGLDASSHSVDATDGFFEDGGTAPGQRPPANAATTWALYTCRMATESGVDGRFTPCAGNGRDAGLLVRPDHLRRRRRYVYRNHNGPMTSIAERPCGHGPTVLRVSAAISQAAAANRARGAGYSG